MSEEALALSGIETVWATLVSAAPPHVMAAASAAGAAASAGVAGAGSGQEKKEIDAVSPHVQPLHPLLSPLRMGDHIRTVAATYDDCTLVHVHGPARSYVRDAPGGERRRDAERRASAVEGIVGAGAEGASAESGGRRPFLPERMEMAGGRRWWDEGRVQGGGAWRRRRGNNSNNRWQRRSGNSSRQAALAFMQQQQQHQTSDATTTAAARDDGKGGSRPPRRRTCTRGRMPWIPFWNSSCMPTRFHGDLPGKVRWPGTYRVIGIGVAVCIY